MKIDVGWDYQQTGKNHQKHSLIFAVICRLEFPGGRFSFLLSLAFRFPVQVTFKHT